MLHQLQVPSNGISFLGIGSNREVNKPVIRRGTMPVFHFGIDSYCILFPDQLCRFSFFLKISPAAGDKQNLPARMFMPVGSAPGSKITFPIGQLKVLSLEPAFQATLPP